MSSREIAEMTEKQHRNVLVDCDKLNEHYREMGLAGISAGVYTHPNTGNQQHREYLLTRIQTLDLITGYNLPLRIRVNRRWEELEKQSKTAQLPQTYADALRQLAEQVEESERQKQIIEEQKPKALFADAVATSNRSCLVGELSKILRQNGVEIGQQRLFKWLRRNGYLCQGGERYNLPTQKSMDLGLFEIKKTVIDKPDGTVLVTTTPKITGKGQIYFVNKFLKAAV
jgi:anti-repressor protein